jgi:quinolinate synthase
LGVEFIDYPGGTGAMTAALRDKDLEAAIVLTEGAVLERIKSALISQGAIEPTATIDTVWYGD